MYPVKIPSLIKPLANDLLWKIDTNERKLYLTFDDGPTPDVTENVLRLLEMHHAKATFFCLGKNAAAHPELFNRLVKAGHAIGNHSYDHPDGWKTPLLPYVKNALRAHHVFKAPLFRPPYGRLTLSQSAMLKKRFRIVMWHIISGDFDQSITKEKCLNNVICNAEPGSIIVFHDSVKAAPNMLYALEETLKHFSAQGYSFHAIT